MPNLPQHSLCHNCFASVYFCLTFPGLSWQLLWLWRGNLHWIYIHATSRCELHAVTPELNWSLIAANMNYEMKKIKVASLSPLELSSEVFKPDERVT